jgi:hypothetical protein
LSIETYLRDPVGDPPGKATEREHDGEHVRREAERAVDDAAVEVDVRVELPIDEVRVLEGGLFEALGDLEQRVLDAELAEDLSVAGRLDDRARGSKFL